MLKSGLLLKILLWLNFCFAGIVLSKTSLVPIITIVHDDIQMHMHSPAVKACSGGVEQIRRVSTELSSPAPWLHI